jgi:mRNA-degrading endonuclease toxin of MazEF toxin-antitoxin module
MIIGADVLNQRRYSIVIVPLSSGPPPAPPLAIAIPSAGRSAVAVVDQIRAAAKERFVRRMGSVSSAELAAVENGLRTILEL